MDKAMIYMTNDVEDKATTMTWAHMDAACRKILWKDSNSKWKCIIDGYL